MASPGRIAVALCLGLAAGCTTIPLRQDPNADQPTGSPPLQIFSVDWWKKLVKPELLEYAPREYASPAIDPLTHRVVVETRDGFVRSIDPDGKVEWEFKTLGSFSAAAAFHEGLVYVPAGDGNLYALKARSGELVWKYAPGEELATSPVFTAGKVLVASHSNTVYAVEQKTGKWLWQYRRDMPSGFTVRGASTPTVSEGIAYVGFADGAVVALKVEDGAVKWERTLSEGNQFIDVDTTPVVDESGRVYVASYKDGVYALDGATGEIRWRSNSPGITHLIERSGVLFGSGDERVTAFLGDGGRVLWNLSLPGRAGRPLVFTHGMLLVPTSAALLFVDPSNGITRLSWNPGKGVSATPLSVDSRLYVLSNLGTLFALRVHGKS